MIEKPIIDKPSEDNGEKKSGGKKENLKQRAYQFTGYVNIADTRSSQVLKWTVAQK